MPLWPTLVSFAARSTVLRPAVHLPPAVQLLVIQAVPLLAVATLAARPILAVPLLAVTAATTLVLLLVPLLATTHVHHLAVLQLQNLAVHQLSHAAA